MITYIEGVDGAGKTTLAKKLVAERGCKLLTLPDADDDKHKLLLSDIHAQRAEVKFSRRLVMCVDDIKKVDKLKRQGLSAVVDRSPISFLVYNIPRGVGYSTLRGWLDCSQAQSIKWTDGTEMVLLHPELNEVMHRINNRTEKELDLVFETPKALTAHHRRYGLIAEAYMELREQTLLRQLKYCTELFNDEGA